MFLYAPSPIACLRGRSIAVRSYWRFLKDIGLIASFQDAWQASLRPSGQLLTQKAFGDIVMTRFRLRMRALRNAAARATGARDSSTPPLPEDPGHTNIQNLRTPSSWGVFYIFCAKVPV